MTDSDEVLLARLRQAAVDDPPPPLVLEAAKAAFVMRTLDAELATLIADSRETVGAVRGPADTRLLVFEAASLTVDLQVTPRGDRRHLVGQVTPAAGPASVDTPGGVRPLELDSYGRFVSDEVPAGPVRLHFGTDGRPVATAWTML